MTLLSVTGARPLRVMAVCRLPDRPTPAKPSVSTSSRGAHSLRGKRRVGDRHARSAGAGGRCDLGIELLRELQWDSLPRPIQDAQQASSVGGLPVVETLHEQIKLLLRRERG